VRAPYVDARRALAASTNGWSWLLATLARTKPFDLDALERLIDGLPVDAEGASPAAAA
jgi:hypothetical protein